MKLLLSLFILICGISHSLHSEEYKFEMKGVKASLISEVKSISPGQKFTVAVYLQHFDGFHTYWKNPGLVGFATTLKWTLPEGFTAGEIQWQVPERSKMLKYNCHAYKGGTYLLVDIQAPEEIPDKFSLSAKVGGMSCSTKECCKIGFIDVGVDLTKSIKPVFDTSAKALIDSARQKLPKDIFGYEVQGQKIKDKVQFILSSETNELVLNEGIYFYSDQNITDTESKQEVSVIDNSLKLTFKLNKYAEKRNRISGLLYNEKGWGKGRNKYLPIEFKLVVED